MPLDYMPEYVDAVTKKKIQELADKETAPTHSEIEVNEYLIRHWCETTEDGNPLYLDAKFAKSRGHKGIVSPPGMLTTWQGPFRWPGPPASGPRAGSIHNTLKDLLELPVGIATDIDVEFYRNMELGDRLSSTSKLASISVPRRTRLGDGHFWAIDNLVRNQKGDLVARYRMTYFGYGGKRKLETVP